MVQLVHTVSDSVPHGVLMYWCASQSLHISHVRSAKGMQSLVWKKPGKHVVQSWHWRLLNAVHGAVSNCAPPHVVQPVHTVSASAEQLVEAYCSGSSHEVQSAQTVSATAVHAVSTNSPSPQSEHGWHSRSDVAVQGAVSNSSSSQVVHCVQTVSLLAVHAVSMKNPLSQTWQA